MDADSPSRRQPGASLSEETAQAFEAGGRGPGGGIPCALGAERAEL